MIKVFLVLLVVFASSATKDESGDMEQRHLSNETKSNETNVLGSRRNLGSAFFYYFFYVVKDNGPKCSSIGLGDISSASECKRAAQGLGIFKHNRVGQGSWGHAPLGCFQGHPNDGFKFTYFNTRYGQTGRSAYRSICRRYRYVVKKNGPKCSDIGLGDITTAEECKMAAQVLGLYKDNRVGQGSWGHAPLGCFQGHPNDGFKFTYFNSRSGKTGRSAYRSICRK